MQSLKIAVVGLLCVAAFSGVTRAQNWRFRHNKPEAFPPAHKTAYPSTEIEYVPPFAGPSVPRPHVVKYPTVEIERDDEDDYFDEDRLKRSAEYPVNEIDEAARQPYPITGGKYGSLAVPRD